MSKISNELLSLIEKNRSKEEIQIASKYINKSYSMFTPDPQLWDELKSIFGGELNPIFNKYSKKMIANELINELLLKYYPCEKTLKYHIIKKIIDNKDIVAFEMQSLNSRIDICRINTYSYAYEIKTEFDNLRRLKKQISDYAKIYEYVYIVVASKYIEKSLDIIPAFCGVITFNSNFPIKLVTKRKAIKSKFLEPSLQLQTLSSKELETILKYHKITNIPSSKKERYYLIINKYCNRTINNDFKKVLKEKYENKWNFIKLNYDKILPIDIQSFFQSSINPTIIYHHDEL